MDATNSLPQLGRPIGTAPSTPLEFWVAVQEGTFLQLDDVFELERCESVEIYRRVAGRHARRGLPSE